jgi:protein-L-isoaspartate(D-aspartate) O-methyltransferase
MDSGKPVESEAFFAVERQRMVDEQIAGRGLLEARLLHAMRVIPRHCFIPKENRHLAYSDGPLPIGYGQTISQPYIVALMTLLLDLDGSETILEVGTGSGYQAAVLAHLAHQVHTIERHAQLAAQASRTLQELDLKNIVVHVGDGSLGLAEFAPYQAILVTAAAPSAPRALLEQLDDGGRLVLPVGGRNNQNLERWRRRSGAAPDSEFEQENLIPVAFVPLRGQFGWQDRDW